MQRKRKRIIVKPINEKCPFCEKKFLPSYKSSSELKSYLTDRAKIMPTTRSGVCTRHQKVLAREIKRARFLALLSVSEKT